MKAVDFYASLSMAALIVSRKLSDLVSVFEHEKFYKLDVIFMLTSTL